MKIIFLTQSLHFGGAERWILSLCRQMRTVDTAAIICTSNFYHPAMLQEARRLTRVIIPGRQQPNGAWQCFAHDVRTAIESLDGIDAIVSWGMPHLASIAENMGLPTVEVSHASGQWKEHRNAVSAAARGASHLAAVSQTAVTSFPTEMQPHASVLYNGIEIDRITPRLGRERQRKAWNIGDEDKVALYVGRYHPVKGALRFVTALEHLPPGWKAVSIGDGPQLSKAKALAKRRKIDVRFCTPTLQIGDCLASADAIVMPSLSEGMPLVMLEAWAAGLPVVTTRHLLVDEMEALHGEVAVTVEQNAKSQEIAQAIQQAVDRRDLVEKMRTIAWQQYTASKMALRWEAYLHEIIGKWKVRELGGIAC